MPDYRKVIICADCGQAAPRTGPVQRYCPACSERRDLARKRLWAAAHPPDESSRRRRLANARYRKALVCDAGRATSADCARSIAWRDPHKPELLWLARVSVPFSYAASKNHLYTLRRNGHLALRREVTAMRRAIAAEIRAALVGQRVAHNKLWLDILVQKPNHRGDAVNVVDLVCDAVQDAIGLDDRWYSLRGLDWEIVKTDPRLFVGLGQDARDDVQVCSHCGQLKALGEFTRKAKSQLGVGRACRACLREGRRLAKHAPARSRETTIIWSPSLN